MTTKAPRLTKPVFEHLSAGQEVTQNPAPRISWRFEYDESTQQAWVQKAYEIELRSPAHANPVVTHVDSDQSVLVPWIGAKLPSRANASIRVRCYGSSSVENHGSSWTEWSEPASIETGLLEASDWQAHWITSSTKQCDGPLRPLRFYKSFTLPPEDALSSKARLYVTSMGVFNAYVNGVKANDEFMAPGWSSYKHRLAYRTIDVTSLLKHGGVPNKICIEVAEGWYAGRLGFNGGTRYIYGDELGLLAQLEISSEASEMFTVATDDSWRVGKSGLISSEIYDGEVYDAREDYGFLSEESELVKLAQASLVSSAPTSTLFISEAPQVKVTETLRPAEVFRSASGKAIIDFGQNIVGKLQITSINLSKGEKITVKHAEVMEHDELGVRPLRKAACTDTIISAGSEICDWTPQFTFHGFRFVQVDGWPGGGLPPKENFRALVLHTDMRRRGFFTCSNESVNRLHSNVMWSMRGNFLSIPTDCPQRDERLGWTGDLQVFCPTATFLYDTLGMLSDWLQDLSSEQLEEGKGGIPPLVCPNVLPKNWPHVAQAVWDDIVVLTPEVLFQYSNDLDLLERQFQSGQAYLEQAVDRGSDGLWKTEGWQLADWLDPTAPPQDPGNGRTDGVMVADAYLVQVTETFARICRRLGKRDLASKYEVEAQSLKRAFQEKYITAAGNLMSNSQTGLALAIQHSLYPGEKQLATATAALSKLVRTARFKIATGFAGTPIITHALTRVGQTQLAYRMLLEKACPSWMYPITMGATTIWERWDSMLPDGRINPGQMTSFNHYALGAVADWLHTTVGGISASEPGWKGFNVRPIPGGNLTSADVSFDGPYGWIRCKWALEGTEFSMELHVPPNSTATVTLPCETKIVSNHVVRSGIHKFSCSFVNQKWPPVPIVAINQQLPPNNTIAT
ncbi:Alpha-L-rhamnosidase [Paramyrothecium foliicola]|nr:Alpha-L-rhamnosidase [Paramyrothecium foliicola]